LEALAGSNPNLQLIGSLPDLSGAEVLDADVILAAFPPEDLAPADSTPPAIVLLTGDSPPPWSQDLLRLGVRAILPQKASAQEILAAVEAAAAGLAVIEPRDLEALLPDATAVANQDGTPLLTARELEVLRMMADGAANKNIAWKLDISEHTVKFHVASILARLGASTRTEAVTIGIRKGLIMV
jgi:DNA-binding NarL/FixJ family response regulator